MLRLTSELGILKSLWLTTSTLPFGSFRNFKVVLLTNYRLSLIIQLCRSSVFTQIRIIIPAFLGCRLLFCIRCHASLKIKDHLITGSLSCGNSRQILLLLSHNYSVVKRLSFAFFRKKMVLYVRSWLRLILVLFWCVRTVCHVMTQKIIHDFKAEPIHRGFIKKAWGI